MLSYGLFINTKHYITGLQERFSRGRPQRNGRTVRNKKLFFFLTCVRWWKMVGEDGTCRTFVNVHGAQLLLFQVSTHCEVCCSLQTTLSRTTVKTGWSIYVVVAQAWCPGWMGSSLFKYLGLASGLSYWVWTGNVLWDLMVSLGFSCISLNQATNRNTQGKFGHLVAENELGQSQWGFYREFHSIKYHQIY